MLQFLRGFFAENIRLKLVALILALTLWFYIVDELNKGTEEEKQLLKTILPTESMAAKKLIIRPILVGRPRWGYKVVSEKVIVVPEYCIVVGNKEMLEKIRFAYTMPVDVTGANKSFTKEVPLNPISPGIYLEDTFVQATVPVEKAK